MLTEGPIDRSLALFGYSRIETRQREWASIHFPAVYKATWTPTDVEHFIYLGADIQNHKYLVGKFGFRSDLAEEFSIASLLKYGHPNFRLWMDHHDRQIGCVINFDFYRLDQIDHRVLLATEANKLAQHVTELVRDRLLLVVREVTTLAKLLELLVSDVEPYPWFATNPIVRAAQIVAIGIHLGIPRRMILDMLRPYYQLISGNLVEPDMKTSVDSFFDHLAVDLAKSRSR
jgi:hypothetical protein